MNYVLPPLPYSYDALEPYLDRKTMEVHHDGHHRAYVENLNKALESFPQYRQKVENLLSNLDSLPLNLRAPVLNNGGGHANHTLFWTILSPTSAVRKPTRQLRDTIDANFGSLENFKLRFGELATGHFSNGWCWLATDRGGKLHLLTTKDHESPLSLQMTPLLVIDLWEHAYYLTYQNKRAEYVKAFWNVVNWSECSHRWEEFCSHGFTYREWSSVA